MLAEKSAYAYAPLLTVLLILAPTALAANAPTEDPEQLRKHLENLFFGPLPQPIDPVPAADPCSPGVGCFPIYVDEQGDTMSGILRMLNTDIEILDEGQLRFDRGSFLSNDEGQIRFPLYFGLTAPALESQGFDPANASADDPGVYILDDAVIHFSDGSQMTPGGSFINHTLVFNNTVTIQGAGNQLFITDGADLIFSGLGGLLTSAGVGRIGTLDFNPFRIIVDNKTAMLFQPGTTPNIIGGHNLNNATTGLVGVFIAGGGNATLPNVATQNFTSILGGLGNTAGGLYAIVIGGFDNEAAGQYSAAGGKQAGALHDGSFVWADSQGVDFDSTDNDQFLIRAAGGVGIGTNAPVSALTVKGDITPATDDTYALGSATNRWDTLYMASEIDYANDLIYTSGAMTRATLTTAGDFTVTGILEADSFVGDGSGLTGVLATSANTLDGLDSTQFVRSDASDSVTAGTFTIGSGAKIALIGPLASDIIPDLNGAYTIGDATHRFTDLWLSSVIHYTDILEFESGGAIHATLDDGGNLTVLGKMAAASFAGDGSGLTGVVATPADDSVDGASIVDGSITAQDLAADSVTGTELADGSVVLAKLGSMCAFSEVLKRGDTGWTCAADDSTAYSAGPGLALAGTAFSIGTNGVVSSMIAADAVTAAHIAADAVGASELGPDAVDGSNVIDNSLTQSDLATGSVASAEIFDGSVTSADIATDTITAADIAAGAVGTSEIADGSIVAADVNSASIQRRVTGSCTAGNAIRVIASDGTVTCQSVGAADTLDGIDSAQFLRSDTSDSFTSGTLTIGSGTDLKLVGTVTGNVIPTTNATYALGDNTHRYTDVWLGSDIHYVTDLEFIDGDSEVTMELVGNNLWVRDLLEASEVEAYFIQSHGGIFVSEDLQVGALSPTDDDSIFFDDGVSEYLRWANAAGRFELSDDTFVQGQVRLDAGTGNAVLHYGNTGLTGQASGWDPNGAGQGVFLEGGSAESAGIYLDGDMAAIWSPGDLDLLRVYDEDFLPSGAASFAVDPSGDIRVGDSSLNDDDSVFFDSTEYLRWANAAGRFEFSDDVSVETLIMAAKILQVTGGNLVFDGNTVCMGTGNCGTRLVAANDVRLEGYSELASGSAGSITGASGADVTPYLTSLGGVSVCYVNFGDVASFTDDGVYLNVDSDTCTGDTVDVGDLRLVSVAGKSAFTTVTGGDAIEVGQSFGATTGAHAGLVDNGSEVSYADVDGNGLFNSADTLYVDTDASGTINAGDVRWTPYGALAAGTFVLSGHADHVAGWPLVGGSAGSFDLDTAIAYWDSLPSGTYSSPDTLYLDISEG